jgi:hypothetical protein
MDDLLLSKNKLKLLHLIKKKHVQLCTNNMFCLYSSLLINMNKRAKKMCPSPIIGKGAQFNSCMKNYIVQICTKGIALI